jgi:hypothetical protein
VSRPANPAIRPVRTAAIVAAIVATALGAAACGATPGTRMPPLKDVPLVSGTRVVEAVRSCNHGSNHYCAQQVVAVGTDYPTSEDLLVAERRYLRTLHWTPDHGDSGKQSAADSPGGELRLTYATASDDLLGVDLGWISRRRAITLALSQVMFDRRPALSLLLEAGPS